MNFNVEVTEKFKKRARQLLKKYPSLKYELAELINSFAIDPIQGIAIGHDCYKVRLAIQSKNRGKSGGARVITHCHIINSTIYLLTIYDKSDQATISDKEIMDLIKEI
jgi:mRNA-degrading endonuclease RelE of RelBE toxin-antitoxin system